MAPAHRQYSRQRGREFFLRLRKFNECVAIVEDFSRQVQLLVMGAGAGLTKLFERVERGTLSQLLRAVEGKSLKGEYIVVVAGADSVQQPDGRDLGTSQSLSIES